MHQVCYTDQIFVFIFPSKQGKIASAQAVAFIIDIVLQTIIFPELICSETGYFYCT